MNESLFNQDSEIAVLSILLKKPEYLDNCNFLNSAMFSSIPHRNLFTIILELKNNNLFPEYSLIISTLKSSETLSSVGGEQYLQFLYNQEYDTSNFSEFCRFIIDSYKSRKLISIYTSVPDYMKSDNIDSVIEKLKAQLNELGTNYSSDNVLSIEDISKLTWNQILTRVNNKDSFMVTTGFRNLDAVTGGYGEGDLWIVASRPGHGKTSYLCNSVLSKIPSLVFSLEMSKESLASRMIAIKTGVPAFDIRMGLLNNSDLNLISESIKEIKDYPIYIDSKYLITPEYLVSSIRKYVKNYGVKVVHIDYVQILIERSTSATHDIGRVARDLKLLSLDMGISVVLYSQLNRLVEMREDKRPILSDLRQSGNLEEDADYVIGLYRDEYYNAETKYKNMMEFLILKARNGPTGTITLKFDPGSNKVGNK